MSGTAAAASGPHGRFLSGPTLGHVVRMTLTGAFGITFVFAVDAANLFWIARLGDPRLVAAIGFAFAIQFFSVSSGIGLMIAAIALVSRSIGAGDRGRARRQATAAALIAGAIQAALAALIVAWRHDLVAMVGATGATAALAARYLALTLPSLAVMAVGMIANGALRAEGDGRRSMVVTLASGLVAMVLDPVLIYGLELGLDGAAAGLVVFRFVMLGMALRFAIGTHDLMARPRLADLGATLRPFLAVALPAILAQMAAPFGNYLLTGVMARFGDDAVAGWAVVGRLTVVAFGGIFAMAGAIGGIFGQNYGARMHDRLRSAYRDAILFGVVYTLVTWLLLALLGDTVARGFGLSAQGADVVHAFCRIGAGGFIFGAMLFVSNAAFNALGRPVRSTLLTWLRDGVLMLPLGLLLARWLGADGVIYAQAAASVVAGSVAGLWGWRYVASLPRLHLPPLDLAPARPYAHADRFRRR